MKKRCSGVRKAPGTCSWLAVTILLSLFVMVCSGCSVYMAAKQPTRKNLEVFSAGTPRSLVLAEIGQPQASEMKAGKRVDVFSFVQGYSKGAKAGRAFFHGAADVLTLGLWEVVGTPTEAIFDGQKVAYEVTYGTSDKVEKAVTLVGEKPGSQSQIAHETKAGPTNTVKADAASVSATEATNEGRESKE